MKLTKQFLKLEYKNKSVPKIAKENNISNSAMYRLFEKYHILRKTQLEAGKLRKIEHKCIICGNKVSKREYKRCRLCENKRKHREYFCKICGKRISNGNGLTGKRRCSSCANKGKNNPMHNRVGVRGDTIIEHHIDLNTKNNKADNKLKMTQRIHSSLHRRAYHYLVEIGLVRDYIKWFFKKIGERKK